MSAEVGQFSDCLFVASKKAFAPGGEAARNSLSDGN